MKTKGNIANILFVLVMFSVYTICALFLSVIGANVYENNATDSEESYNNRTSILYLTEKIRQNDNSDGISVREYNGTQILVLHKTYDEDKYESLIYVEDGFLCETLVPEGFELIRGLGQKIMPITSIGFDMSTSQLLELDVVDASGTAHSTMLYLECTYDINRTVEEVSS